MGPARMLTLIAASGGSLFVAKFDIRYVYGYLTYAMHVN